MEQKHYNKLHSTSSSPQKLADYFKFLSSSPSSVKMDADRIYGTEAGKQLRVLENLQHKTYDAGHLKKICQLLKKKDKNYAKKRKNINKTTYGFDENNNLYLTLPKFDYGKRIREIINEKKQAEDKEKGLLLGSHREYDIEDKKHHLEDLIPEFFENNKTKSEESLDGDYQLYESSSESDLNEVDQQKLWDKLRTKKNFNKQPENENLINSQNVRIRNKFLHNSQNEISSIGNGSYHNRSQIRASTLSLIKSHSQASNGKFLTSLDYAVNKSFKQDQSLTDIKIDPLYENIKKLRKKVRIIRKEKNKEKKVKIHPVDLFYYDEKKWQKQKEKESDKILQHIKDFESRRNQMFNKMMVSVKIPASSNRKSKLFFNRKSLENTLFRDVKEFHKIESKELTDRDPKVMLLPKLSSKMIRRSITNLNVNF